MLPAGAVRLGIASKMSEQAVSALALGKSTISRVSGKNTNIGPAFTKGRLGTEVCRGVRFSAADPGNMLSARSGTSGLLRSWMGDTSIATARRSVYGSCWHNQPWPGGYILGDLISAGLKAIADRQRPGSARHNGSASAKAMGQCPDCREPGKSSGKVDSSAEGPGGTNPARVAKAQVNSWTPARHEYLSDAERSLAAGGTGSRCCAQAEVGPVQMFCGITKVSDILYDPGAAPHPDDGRGSGPRASGDCRGPDTP